MKAVFTALLLLLSTGAFADDLAGTWILNIDTPRGVQHPTLVINETESAYSGVYNSRRGPIAIDTIEIDGTAFSFTIKVTVPIGEMDMNYVGRIDGDEMEGTVQNPRGEVPFTGKRQES